MPTLPLESSFNCDRAANGVTARHRCLTIDESRSPANVLLGAFRDGWTARRRRASRNPAAPRNAVAPWEAGAPRSAASPWEAAANPWLGAIARRSRTGSSNPSPSEREVLGEPVAAPLYACVLSPIFCGAALLAAAGGWRADHHTARVGVRTAVISAISGRGAGKWRRQNERGA